MLFSLFSYKIRQRQNIIESGQSMFFYFMGNIYTRIERVDRVQLPGGQVHQINEFFSNVREYQPRRGGGRCWVIVGNSGSSGVLGHAGSILGALRGRPRFSNGDSFVTDRADSITFPCVRR